MIELSSPARLVIDFDTSRPCGHAIAGAHASTDVAAISRPKLADALHLCRPQRWLTYRHVTGATTDVRIAHQPAGYDRIVFEFAGGPVPAYTLTRQASTHFIKDASGQLVTLQGSAGLKLVFHGASGYPTYTKSTDLQPGLPAVREVEQLGDFEGVLSWGIGLAQPACMRTLELSGKTRLVVDIQTP